MKLDNKRLENLSEGNDLTFKINSEGMFPLLIAASLGK